MAQQQQQAANFGKFSDRKFHAWGHRFGVALDTPLHTGYFRNAAHRRLIRFGSYPARGHDYDPAKMRFFAILHGDFRAAMKNKKKFDRNIGKGSMLNG